MSISSVRTADQDRQVPPACTCGHLHACADGVALALFTPRDALFAGRGGRCGQKKAVCGRVEQGAADVGGDPKQNQRGTKTAL